MSDPTVHEVVKKMDTDDAVGLLHDGAGWDAARIATEIASTPSQVRRNVARARLKAADSDCKPCDQHVEGLMTFSAAAIDHALTCTNCDDARRALRQGKLALRHRWQGDTEGSAPPAHPTKPDGLRQLSGPVRQQDRRQPVAIPARTTPAFPPVQPAAPPARLTNTAPQSTNRHATRQRGPVRTVAVTLLAMLAHIPRAVLAVGLGAGLVAGGTGLWIAETGAADTDNAEGPQFLPPAPSDQPLTSDTRAGADAAGASPAATAMPSVSTTPAPPGTPSRPSLRTWQRLAACESSSNWGINSGNGFYGGLQFTLDSWRLVGGSGYPHKHPALEQIRRAERLLDLQGWVAWPVCSAKLGLR